MLRLRKKPTVAPEPVYFACPACGASFKVRSETSERIFCSHECIRLYRESRPDRAAVSVGEEGEALRSEGE